MFNTYSRGGIVTLRFVLYAFSAKGPTYDYAATETEAFFYVIYLFLS